jgi:NTE family protein
VDDRRALVLGGGGITGVAWETGLLAGLSAAGVPVDRPDLVVGTSAGSVVGAQLASGTPLEELYERQLAPVSGQPAPAVGIRVIAGFMASAFGSDDRKARARLGRRALRATTAPESTRRDVIAQRLPSHDWPSSTDLVVIAVAAETGDVAAWRRESGVPLVDAVAASCAVPVVWPPMTVDGRRYVDGGVRSPVNADYATGCERVLVLAPTTAAFRRSGRIPRQLASLGTGVRSLVISPDAAARAEMGRNVLDAAFRAASARAGRRQAEHAVAAVADLWA